MIQNPYAFLSCVPSVYPLLHAGLWKYDLSELLMTLWLNEISKWASMAMSDAQIVQFAPHQFFAPQHEMSKQNIQFQGTITFMGLNANYLVQQLSHT